MKLIIEITLVLKDAQDFQRHVAAMKSFRQSHPDNPRHGPEMLRDRPNIHPADSQGVARHFIRTKAKPTLVPIWKMELPRDIQN